MDRETARQRIRENWKYVLDRTGQRAPKDIKGEPTFICPFCGNGGNGKSGDGLQHNPKSKDGCGLKCFGCGWSGDAIDYYQQTHNCGYNEALDNLASWLGISIDGYTPTGTHSTAQEAAGGGKQDKGDSLPSQAAEAPTEAEMAQYCFECYQRIRDPEAVAYLQHRGISQATAEAYWLGFDPQADPVFAPAGKGTLRHPEPRIIIPVTGQHYIGRATRSGIKKEYAKMNNKGGKIGIFNHNALAQGAQEVFITEGIFDALSILEAGGTAIALNSTSNAGALLETLEACRTEATLVLCLDSDKAGKDATETLKEGLRRLSIPFITADLNGQYKDPNEHLQADRDGFISAVQEAQRQTAAKPDNVGIYIDSFMSDEIAAFKNDIKTGFENLDAQAGGLYSGLYVLAAISSLGKTTFALQLADQIAAAGTDVLYFSLEQSRLEMVTKSISRITAQHNLDTAVSSLSIRKGYLPRQVLEAAEEYKATVGDRMSIIEGNFSCSISFIGDYIRRFMGRNKTKPVVVVDYLQILQPEEKDGRTQTTKETVDSTVTTLKRLSREQGITIIVICSVNRANYLTPIDFESLKESGGIEYTADVVWGLQLNCLKSDPAFQSDNKEKKREAVNKAKLESPRKVDLVCLKNRYGIANYTCSFAYYPASDLFKAVDTYPCAEPPKKANRRVGG